MRWKNMTAGKPDHYIPPRSRCLYSVLVMHRRKDLWGPDGTPIQLMLAPALTSRNSPQR